MTMGPEPIIRILWRSSRRGTSIFLYQSRFTRRAPRPIQPCRRADSGQKPKSERQPRPRSECVLRTVSAVRIDASSAEQVPHTRPISSFPGGAWERQPPKLRFGRFKEDGDTCESHMWGIYSRERFERRRPKRSFGGVRSQAEPGNEVRGGEVCGGGSAGRRRRADFHPYSISLRGPGTL